MSQGTPPASSGSGAVSPISTLNLTDDAPESVPVLGSIIADKYRVEELIARGGMGAVYLATHLVSGKRLAMKWMLPTLGKVPGAKERFVREACATARIDHPNVVDIYDVGTEGSSVYLVMELLRGETLAQYLQRSPRVSAADAVALLMPALRGVAAAHAQQVIHRDLKPENIFLCRSSDGEPRDPKVLDFGISKITSEDGFDLALTRSGAVMGTPYYMSPEQVRGAREVDERGDVYAFGVMLYEMLAGQRPFDAETYNQLILKIATEDPAPIPELNADVDSRLVALVERAMARDPRTRFQSIEALALALEPFASGALFRASTVRLHSAAPSGDDFDSLKPGRRKLVRKRFMAAGIALGCMLTGFGLWALSGLEPLSHRVRSNGSHGAAITATPAALAPLAPKSLGAAATRTETTSSPATAAHTGATLGERVNSAEAATAVPEEAPAQETGPAPEPRARSRAERESERAARESGKERRATERESRDEAGNKRAPDHGHDEASGRGKVTAPTSGSGRSRLPDDWDDRLSIPSRPANGNTAAAGPLDARDLR